MGVYYCVNELSRTFFQILDAGRRDITDVAVGAGQRAARCGNPVKCFVAKSPVAKPCHIREFDTCKRKKVPRSQ